MGIQPHALILLYLNGACKEAYLVVILYHNILNVFSNSLYSNLITAILYFSIYMKTSELFVKAYRNMSKQKRRKTAKLLLPEKESYTLLLHCNLRENPRSLLMYVDFLLYRIK